MGKTAPDGTKASSRLAPRDLAREGLAALKAKANPKQAEGAQKYFKDQVQIMGLTSADVRLLAQTMFLKVEDAWTADQAVDLGNILLPNPFLEAKSLAILILGRLVRTTRPAHFQKMRSWFESDYLDNWASTDVFCGEVLSPYLERFPEFKAKLKEWTKAPNMWVRRASAVALVTPARRGKDLDLAYDIAVRLFDNPEDLMHKACGWLLREAGKTDMARLEKFLLAHGPKIPRTSLRYAIERFEPRKRKALLVATSARPR